MSAKKYIKYTGAKLSPGDIVELNGDGVPYIYEGEIGKTNTWPLCAARVDDLPRYDSCAGFLEGTGNGDKIIRNDYKIKDYTTSSIPVSAFDRIYINPFAERLPGHCIMMNNKKFFKTGGAGTVTHILSAMPMLCDGNPLGGGSISTESVEVDTVDTVSDSESSTIVYSMSAWDDSVLWNDSYMWQDE